MDERDRVHPPEIELPPIPLPGYEARQRARAMIWLSAMACGLSWLLFVIAPAWMGPEPPGGAWLMPLIGLGMQTLGLGWMVRIYRAAIDVEPDGHHWRYRD